MRRRTVVLLSAGVLLFSLTSTETNTSLAQTGSIALPGKLQTVFVLVMENQNWSSILGSTNAPYINGTLLPIAAHTERYYNPPGNHPSLPNYLWMEIGGNLGVLDDGPPSAHPQIWTGHLVTRLKGKGITWKAYMEGITGTECPLADNGDYAVHHNPFVYFNDVTNNLDPNSAYCIAHIRPLTELATDLAAGTVAQYNFIAPSLCNDMHSSCNGANQIQLGDAWLSVNVPLILASTAYQSGALFITWDEAGHGDGPIGMIVLSPFAKPGYRNWIRYNHSALLRTLQIIFGLVPPLPGDIAHDAELSDLFATFP
jgi:phosphatidylinositol-3-phosphatase